MTSHPYCVIIVKRSKKTPEYAAMAQLVEHILGKDEVISSTLISSFRVALAQLDRVFGYEPKGRGFESLMPRKKGSILGCFLFSSQKSLRA